MPDMSSTHSKPEVIAQDDYAEITWFSHVGTEDDAREAYHAMTCDPRDQLEVCLVGMRPHDPDEDCGEEAPHDDPEVCDCSTKLADGFLWQCDPDDPRAQKAWRVELADA